VTGGTEIVAVLLFGMEPGVRTDAVVVLGAVGPRIGIGLFLRGVVSVPGPAGSANRDRMPASGLGLAPVAGTADVAGAGAALAGGGGDGGAGGIRDSASWRGIHSSEPTNRAWSANVKRPSATRSCTFCSVKGPKTTPARSTWISVIFSSGTLVELIFYAGRKLSGVVNQVEHQPLVWH
jgi:hypothetical protein